MGCLLDVLPFEVLLRVVGFAFRATHPRLGLQRCYNVSGTRIVIRDDKVYRTSNVPPTPVVKRALMAIWRTGIATHGRVDLRIRTMGTPSVVRYNCELQGFDDNTPAPTELVHLNISSADA